MFVCLCMYGQLLVLVIQPCCSSSLSDVHVPNLYLHIDEQIKNQSISLSGPLIFTGSKNREIWPDFQHYISAAESIGVFSITFTYPSRKLPNSVKGRRGYGYYALQGHSKSPILVPIESSYVTLVINSNLPPISHRFWDIALEGSKTGPDLTGGRPGAQFI